MHLTRLPSGSWRVSVKHGGRRATATARTRAQAQQAGAELLLALGASPKAGDVTVAELTGSWLAASTLSVGYWADAVRVIDRLPATFLERRLTDVTPAVIEHLYRQLAMATAEAPGLSVHRIARVHTVLSSCWTLALRYEWAVTNPFRSARKPAPPTSQVHPPPVDVVQRLLAATDDRFRLYLHVAVLIGARRGEVVALQWGSVGEASITVERALAYAPRSGVVVVEGKIGAKGHRTVAIPADLAAELSAWRKRQAGLARRAGLPAPVWVFSHDAGVSPWRPEFVSQRFRRLRKETGATGVRLHDLRHFMASQLLAAGVPVPVVSHRLGHTYMSTTTKVYGHQIPAADQLAADAMSRILGA